MMEQLFLLLRIGLGLEASIPDDLSLLNEMTEEDWQALRDMAEKQGVSAIALDGLSDLLLNDKAFHESVNKENWKRFVLQWTGNLLYIEKANQKQVVILNELSSRWACDNIRVMLMKGQANGLLYPKPYHRCPGDIDCYLFEDYSVGNTIARSLGAEVDESWYKHSAIHYKGELFENHQYFVHTREGKQSKRLQKDLEEALKVTEWKYFPDSDILLPPVQWNAMFLTYHACAHFITEGLHLKQVLDWAMFLLQEQHNVNWEEYYSFCERYHLRRFADAITAICVKYLGVAVSAPGLVSESPYADKVLQSSLFDDDYIYGTGESRWSGRVHLLKSMFKHRWKYEEIYQQSVWKQLWWYITGFLFHTE